MTSTQQPQTNGTSPASPTFKTFDHLKEFPLIAKGISMFESNSYGQRTISLSHSAYVRFIAPLSPYLSKAAPYVQKADDLADGGLVQVETRFPVVKEPTDSLKTKVSDTLGYPKKLVGEVIVKGTEFAKNEKEYVFKVYDDHYGKLDKDKKGYVPMAYAGLQTGVIVSSELVNAITGYLSGKKAETEEKINNH